MYVTSCYASVSTVKYVRKMSEYKPDYNLTTIVTTNIDLTTQGFV